MENSTFEFSHVAKYLFGYKDPCPKETMSNYGCALLFIASGDGIVSQQEMDWLTKYFAYVVGVPQDIVDSWRKFDPEKTNLEKIFENLKGINVNFKKALIYDSIRMASVDGFESREKDRLYKMASLLGLNEKTVKQINSIVEIENALNDQIAILLETPKSAN